MKITYRIPSRKVPYGFVEVEWEKADAVMPDPVVMAEDYAQFIKDYQAAEVQAFENPTGTQLARADKSVDEATKMLNDGLGGVEEIDENAPVKPWDKSADESTTESKPWEADEADWDFS